MKDQITNRLNSLSQEVEILMQERQDMQRRDQEIEVRLHQLVGAIYELQQLISLENQPSSKAPDSEQLDPVVMEGQLEVMNRPSAYNDQGNHQEQLKEIGKNSRQQI
jgi:hypothetical protein